MALKGIVIDPGHGGSDPGAVGNNLREKDLNLKISKYMYDRLRELGINTSLTRDSDITLSPAQRTKKVSSFYGTGNDVIVVSNHLNAGGGNGAEVIYALRNNSTLAKKILDNIESEGQVVRKYYQQRLPSNPNKDYYFMLRDTTNNESVIVEYGFIDNSEDIKRVEQNYKNYVEAVIKAICDYKGIEYIPVSDNLYAVKSGDSLWAISKKFNTTVSKLKELNNLTSNNLKIGQKLQIPKEEIKDDNKDYIEYVVVKGDSLSKIAKNYNTTVSKIKELNNLSTDLIKINQILKIPKNYVEYVVVKGDTLYGIANKYNTTVSKIKELNNLSTNLLQINQKLLIPR